MWTEEPRLRDRVTADTGGAQVDDGSGAESGHSQRPSVTPRIRRLDEVLSAPPIDRLIRIAANVVGAVGAAFFAQATLQHYLATRQLIGAAFFVEQMWVVIAYLIRRPARTVSRRMSDWLLAFGGTFGGVLFDPTAHIPSGGSPQDSWSSCSALRSASRRFSLLEDHSDSSPRTEDW